MSITIAIIAVAFLASVTVVACVAIHAWMVMHTASPIEKREPSPLSDDVKRQLLLERARMDNFFNYDGSTQDTPEEIVQSRLENGG